MEAKIIIADDHPLIHQALTVSIKKQPCWKIVAEAFDGEEAVQLTKEFLPDIIIMDINMPKINGIEATRKISQECPSVAVLVLTVYDDRDMAANVINVGAKGYLPKTASSEQVIQAIKNIMRGECVFSFSIDTNMDYSSRKIREKHPTPRKYELSPREFEIIQLVGKGATNKEISLMLGLQESSVKAYLKDIFIKLDVGTRTEAVSVCLRSGILTVNDLR